jgi:uncharacterized metal-binding protein YceD (DUF177 family)
MQQKMTFQPKTLALAERKIQGAIAIADMPRLKTALAKDCGQLCFVIAGKRNGDELVIDLAMDGEVVVFCGRCLEHLTIPLRYTGRFLVVQNAAKAEEDDLVNDYLESEETMNIHDWLEDEAILNLPFSAFHAECEIMGISSRNHVTYSSIE